MLVQILRGLQMTRSTRLLQRLISDTARIRMLGIDTLDQSQATCLSSIDQDGVQLIYQEDMVILGEVKTVDDDRHSGCESSVYLRQSIIF